MVSSSQPLASAAGVEILRAGGSAADAAIGMAAALAVTEPCSTGLGGDAFILYYQASKRKVYALNGSGRAPAGLSIERVRQNGYANGLPPWHADTVTVPGACAAWFDLHDRFGCLPAQMVFKPAVRLAQDGFQVAPLTSYYWREAAKKQLANSLNGMELTIHGKGPNPGQVFQNPGMVKTLEMLSAHGKRIFYEGEMGKAIVDTIQQAGGCMELSDLSAHSSTWEEPFFSEYMGVRLWECGPNSQGLVALQALEILKQFGINQTMPFSADRLHLEIEALRLAFEDAKAYLADPSFIATPVTGLLSPEYNCLRAREIHLEKANPSPLAGTPLGTSDTVYFCAMDADGNACSMVNSNYIHFGTGIVPAGYGFSLQNRGLGFSLNPDHPNALQPRKRPYHTIIPALATRADDASLYAVLGVMGGYMQPQGHLQVFLSMLQDGLDPQQALELPRFCIEVADRGGDILIEEGMPDDVIQGLIGRGHVLHLVTGYSRSVFGRGQVIMVTEDGMRCAGSDPRADGCAMAEVLDKKKE